MTEVELWIASCSHVFNSECSLFDVLFILIIVTAMQQQQIRVIYLRTFKTQRTDFQFTIKVSNEKSKITCYR